MVALIPPPSALGPGSPALGPWFVQSSSGPSPIQLGAPAADLSIPVTIEAQMRWRAPAGAMLSLFVTTPEARPAGLAALRQIDGTPAFADNRLVALLTLLPEVEERLAALVGALVPAVSGTAPGPGLSSRAVVRHLALDLPLPSDLDALEALLASPVPSDVTGAADRAAYLGLTFENGTLGNAARPMTELHRPGFDTRSVLNNTSGAPVDANLWAFDDRGRPVDPGAVAAWWSFIASGGAQFDNLWAETATGLQYVCTSDPGLYVQFCNPSEGKVADAHLNRLLLNGLTAIDAPAALYSYQVTGTSTLGLTPAPVPDDMPMPRIATLPTGPYNTPTLAPVFAGWNGPLPLTVTRDFVRIAVTDIERHLVGLGRDTPSQADPDSRVGAASNTAPNPVLTNADAVANQMLTVLGASNAAAAMMPGFDLDFSALATPAFGTGTVPIALSFTATTLAGLGTDNGGSVSGQRIIFQFASGSLPAGAWVRIWPLGLDTQTGRRFRMDGGGGLADGTGAAFVVAMLPDGTDGAGIAVDAMVVARGVSRLYTDLGFTRPAVDMTGGMVALNNLGAYTAWSCEQGTAVTAGAGAIIGGASLVAVPQDPSTDPFRLINPTSLAPADIIAQSLRNGSAAGDTLITTMPAFVATTEGDLPLPTPPLMSAPTGPGGSMVVYRPRNALLDDIFDTTAPLSNLTLMGRPLPMMERREAVAFDITTATGLVGGHTGRKTTHESLPVQQGHPGLPAAPEVHSTGIALAGPAAAGTRASGLTMLMRERVATNLIAFLNAAAVGIPIPVPAPSPTTFAAVLETVGNGVSGDGIIREILKLGTFEPGQGWDAFKTAVQAGLGFSLEPLIDAAIADDTLAAAVDQMLRKTAQGATEALTSLQAAIGAAEDFLYIETPALDTLTAGATDEVNLIGALTTRLNERPHLRLILCLPERFLPEQPDRLEQVRRAGIRDAIGVLTEAAPGRVTVFSSIAGPGRPHYMATTTVVIDDAYLQTGTTHLWRRGLTFDTSISVAVMGDALTLGRPATIIAARRQLLADRLGVAVTLIPDDPVQMQAVIEDLHHAKGLGMISSDTYPWSAITLSETDLGVWNPDGTPGDHDWFTFLRDLIDDAAADVVNNAIR